MSKDAKCLLYEETLRSAESIGSLYRDTRPCRDDLFEFMDANEWFGQVLMGNGDEIYLRDMAPAMQPLMVWLKAYRQSPEKKIAVIFDAYQGRFPLTCGWYKDFMVEKADSGPDGHLRVLDYILSSISREITEYDESEIQVILAGADKYLAVANTKLLLEFLYGMKKKGLVIRWRYEIHSRRVIERENSAYTMADFAKMAYWTFNRDAWEEKTLVEKAAASKRCADLWLFIALHFICAWRKTDMERLPFPEPPYPGKILRERILDHSFEEDAAVSLADGWIFLIGILAMKPKKTDNYCGVPELKIFIPESLKVPFGIILALALSHHKTGEACVMAYAEISLIKNFFGAGFAAIAGRRHFKTRRANKAFLQGIEMIADDTPGKAKGYMLAALARSHKGGIGTLADITEIYLKDENFTGYRPEFILREMFERGIFGFIPAMLLESYAGTQFKRLSISAQTELIKCVGVEPVQIEALAECVRKSMTEAEVIVRSMMADFQNPKEQLKTALQKIAAGGAPSKQPELLCIRIAMGYKCQETDRSCCIGCGYEIYTKSAFQLLVQEYVELNHKKDSSTGWEQERYKQLLKQGVMPAITEIITSMPLLYPEADMKPLMEMVERGIKYAAIGEY